MSVEVYPTHVAAAESMLVGAALTAPAEAFTNKLKHTQFFDVQLKSIWKHAAKLYESTQDVDVIHLGDSLARDGLLDGVGGLSRLSALALNAAEPGSIGACAEVVRAASVQRSLLSLGAKVEELIATGAENTEVADRVRAYLDALVDATDAEGTPLSTEIRSELDRIHEDLTALRGGSLKQVGLPSGIGLEKYVPGGIPRDRMTILFGETGTFKTAIKQLMCDSIAMSGEYVLDFSIEDSAELTAQRFIARYSGIPYSRIIARDLSDAEMSRIAELTPTAKAASERVIVVGNVPATIEEAIRISRYWAQRVKLAAVFVDYIQIMDVDGSDTAKEYQQLYRICKMAQRAAHRDRIAWVLVSQNNKAAENRTDRRPMLNDLYGSSAMKQTCKLAVGVYRPFAYERVPGENSPWRELFTKDPEGPAKYAKGVELWIRKNLAGETNVCVPALLDPGTGVLEVL